MECFPHWARVTGYAEVVPLPDRTITSGLPTIHPLDTGRALVGDWQLGVGLRYK